MGPKAESLAVRSGLWRSASVGGKKEGEGRAGIDLAEYADGAAMKFHDSPDDDKAQSRAAAVTDSLSAIILVKEMCELFWRHAGAGV